MAFVPDEAAIAGREVSLAARALYQVICVYRNKESGECFLKDQKRMAFEAGIDYTHASVVKKELIEKRWIRTGNRGVIIPLKGFPQKAATLDKPKSDATDKAVTVMPVESLDKPKSLDKPNSPATDLWINQSPTLDKPKGTGIADSKEFLFTSQSNQREREKAHTRDLENPPWESQDGNGSRPPEILGALSPAVSYWFKTCLAKRDDPEYQHRSRLPTAPNIRICEVIDTRVTDLGAWKQAVNEWDVQQRMMHNLSNILDRHDEILFKRSKGIGVSNDASSRSDRIRERIASRNNGNPLPDNREGAAVLRDVSAPRRTTAGDR